MAGRAEINHVGRNGFLARIPAKEIDNRNSCSNGEGRFDDAYFEPYFDSLLSAITYFCNSEPNSTSELMHCKLYKMIAASSTS